MLSEELSTLHRARRETPQPYVNSAELIPVHLASPHRLPVHLAGIGLASGVLVSCVHTVPSIKRSACVQKQGDLSEPAANSRLPQQFNLVGK